MAKKRDRPTVCHNCKTVLQGRHHGPCPSCGHQPTAGRHAVPSVHPFKRSLASDTRRNFYEAHKPIAVVMMLIIFTFPIAGVFVKGVSGLLFGVVSSVLGYYLLPYTAHVVRRWSGRADG
jgi:hypothetical protein